MDERNDYNSIPEQLSIKPLKINKMRQTAMQELLEFCEYRLSKSSNNNLAAWNMILAKINDDSLLAMEKEQIVITFKDAQANHAMGNELRAEQYCNETFKNK